jgi:hypothetical protein
MVQTVADRLGITFNEAEEMAAAATKAGLVRHEWDTVTLTGERASDDSNRANRQKAGRPPSIGDTISHSSQASASFPTERDARFEGLTVSPVDVLSLI